METIREATAADAACISRLNIDVQKLHADALPHLFKQPSATTFPPAAVVELMAEPHNIFFLAEVDGAAVGYVWVEIRRRPEDAAQFARNSVLIHHISVTPAHQGHGHGDRLMVAVKALAKAGDITTVVLDTWSFNTEAHRFFERQGCSIFNYRLWTEVT
jgi:ribosomal protein S18 acetylase RimI-like enzyme